MGEVFVPQQIIDADLSFAKQFSKNDLSFGLSHSIREVKKLDTSDYPPNTLSKIDVMIQMHLNQNGLF